MKSSIFIALLWLNGFVTTEEAHELQLKIPGEKVPENWTGFLNQVEELLRRELKRKHAEN